MPWKIFPEGGKACIYKHDEAGNKVGPSKGCHPNRKAAIPQLRALHASENKEMIIGEKARADLSGGDFLVPKERSLPITKTPGGEPDRGLCGAAHAALFSPAGFRGNKYEGPNKEAAKKRLRAIYSRMDWPWPEGEKAFCPTCYGPVNTKEMIICPSCYEPVDVETMHGLKAFEQDGERYLVLWTSNAFKDRELETFKTKAWEDYVTRRDSRGGKYDRVWFWHAKGTDFADIVWEDMVGRILVDVARLDHTPYADKMYHGITHPDEFTDIAPLGWGTSHGFAYRVGDKQQGVYDFVEKFESTVLPYHRASNLWGGIKEVLDMAVTKEKKDALARLVGTELAEQTLQEAEKATGILEQAGISFKEDDVEDEADTEEVDEEELDVEDEEEPEDEEEAEGDDNPDGDMYELEVTDELVKEIASQVPIATSVKEAVDNTVKGLKEAILAELTPIIVNAVNEAMTTQLTGQKEQIVQQALSGKISLKPWSASSADETVAGEAAVKGAKEAKSGKKQEDVVATIVSNMLTGKV